MSLIEPSVHALDLLALHSKVNLRASLEKAYLQLLAQLDDEGLKKNALLALLHKTQSAKDDVRLAAVVTLKAAWKARGHDLVGCLSDVLLFAVELLEDECDGVQTATRSLLAVIEDVTGEDVGEMLKQ